jgi:hypothetical protein
MRTPRTLHLPLVGGPLDGRRRHVHRAPQELPVSIALPCTQDRRQARLPDDQELAVYQLRNDNGQWRYYHQQTATARQLGVEDEHPNEAAWSEECPALFR